MDDFEKEFPGFDWRNIPAIKHPGKMKCPCPKHDFLREQLAYIKTVNKTAKSVDEIARMTFKFCPDHYRVYINEIIPTLNFVQKLMFKIATKSGAVKLVELDHRNSEDCYFCKFGSGGAGEKKKPEMPPVF